MRSSFTIPIAIILGGIIVAAAVYVSAKNIAPDSSLGNPMLVRPVEASDHILGNPAAKVIIVEYSDFDCEFCKTFNDTLHQIVANEGASGQVAWVFRNFPLIEINPDALSDAQAAECVAQVAGNDAYWKFADALFANQPVDQSDYGTLALSAGVPVGSAFATCFANAPTSAINARIMSDRENALDVGAQGTPYSLILVQGKVSAVMNGAYSYDAVKSLVDQTLGKNI